MAATARAADAAGDIADDAAPGPGKKKAKRKFPTRILIIGAAVLVLVAGVGTGAYVMLSGSKQASHAASAAKPAVFVDLPDILVNLAGTSGDRPQYLKVKIVLEVPDQATAKQIQPLMPRVVDIFQTYLRELRASDLDGSVGLFRLREELTRRVNAVLAPGHVDAVLFKEIIIQ